MSNESKIQTGKLLYGRTTLKDITSKPLAIPATQMNDFESFHYDLYHAKLKWMAIQSGYISVLWDDKIQNKINAISNLGNDNHSVEAHIIAVKSYFGEDINLESIIKIISICLKEQSNKSAFTMCVFNRFNLKSSSRKLFLI